MSDHVASSRSWIVTLFMAAAAASGCGDDAKDQGDQLAAGASAGKSASATAGVAGLRAAGDAGDDAAASGGATGAAGGGGASGSAAGGGGSRAGTPAMAMDDGMPTWSGIYQFTFWSCRNESCHGAGLVGLNFATKDAAWDSLVNEPANPMFECTQLDKQRVVPGEPDNSLLYLKLDINAPCGQQMPPGGLLSEAARNRVREWILLGAKND